MRLADFIESNTDAILAEWVEFASASGPAGKAMDIAALRDHAREMLAVIVTDLRTPQTGRQQSEKSKGNAPELPGATAAGVHGSGRAESGFTLAEMVSEYRALRASIIRLWTEANGSLTGEDLDDLMRFNEAIDQSAAESIEQFTEDLDRSKEMFLAILGHDLRSPLSAVVMSAKFMLERGKLDSTDTELATGTLRSGRRMNQLVDDLLDFTRSRLGDGLPIVRADMDMGGVARHAVEEVSAANPQRAIRVATTGDLHGSWDAARISQLLANLLSNAVQHGSRTEPITVTLRGEDGDVLLSVHNRGAAIPAADVPRIFDALKWLGPNQKATSDAGNLGLGLYIADQIVKAHHGSIDVRSTDAEGTEFTVRLPRG